MSHLDQYAINPDTPTPPADSGDQSLAVPEREDEDALAREAPQTEEVHPSESLASSGIDPAMRLQDAVGTWPEGTDTTAEEVGQPDADDQGEPAPEPYVPLTDSGGQGI
jgi:hypothetical protein